MSVRLRSILLGVLGLGIDLMISYAPPTWSPEWFNYGMFATGIALVCAAVTIWLILSLHERSVTTQESVILPFDVSRWIPLITKYHYMIFIVFAILAFPIGVSFSPSVPNSQSKRVPSPAVIEGNPSSSQVDGSIVIPLTPARLLEIARTQTTRDAMSYKGSSVQFQGTVVNISDVSERWLEADASRKPVIGIRVAIGSLPHDRNSDDQIHMFVEADRWKTQADKIKRGDWIVAKGIVDHVSIHMVGLIYGEIISVSRVDNNRR